MIRFIGKPLEIAEEKEITLIINGRCYYLACTPKMLKELAIGFLVSEGLVRKIEDLSVEIFDDTVIVKSMRSKENFEATEVKIKIDEKIECRVKFKLEDLRRSLSLLEIEEYRRTRGYHVAAVVGKNQFFRAYDVGRHNAVDKAIGLAKLNKANLDEYFLLLSGRISVGIARKCLNAGIPLIVSKAAIFDSAIDFCKKTGLSAVSFATNMAIGNAIE
ncbi:MAG: formate dehydrogenase accessory sulfurtransferase FdhD [Archaeoglobaceae archaeon]|nr:formate dehydrogenase accessory sulfurtransferase FdhD [Archaeoglobaceae archaeon]MDW7989873.1 formate dehydrogenase accessory sulfurtransferase FdhD [Archaeoglobaceae archaeon]